MNSNIILICVVVYFLGLLFIAFRTSRNSDNQSFFIGNRKSKWWLVAFGMIGTSLSGVTFISVPGTVGKLTGTEYVYGGFEYYIMVIGFFLGYLDRKSTRLNSSHVRISYAVFCLKKKKNVYTF